MVSTEISIHFANDYNTLQTRLEEINPPYKRSRELYNALLKKTFNPLENSGLAGDKLTFIILLLEKTLRNTEIIFDQNITTRNKLQTIEQTVIQLKQDGLDPIINAGNNIAAELKRFELGFKTWNIKFDKFQEIFEHWDTGFQDFDTNFAKLEKFLDDFSKYWIEKTDLIQQNLNHIDQHINQWNNEILRLNNSVESLEKRFYSFEQRQSQPRFIPQTQTFPPTSSTSKQLYQILPSNNHKWKL